MKKIVAIVMAIVSFFATIFGFLTGRGDKPVDPTPTTAVVTTAKPTTTKPTTTKAPTTAAGLNSTDKAAVVKFYAAAAKATGNNIEVNREKSLEKLNGGKGGVGNIISSLESIGKKALAKNSGKDKGFRGYPNLLKADDLTSAKAEVKGNYTEITMKVKDYTALPTGKANEGSVGHAIGVLDTIDEALNELPLTVKDTSNIRLIYTNASVVCKVDNKTNKVVSATWEYLVTIKINNTSAKMGGIPFTLDGAEIVIKYKATY